MALVCDIKSNMPDEEGPPKAEEDLEDGEIEDDDEEASEVPQEPPPPEVVSPTPVKVEKGNSNDKIDRDRPREKTEKPERRRHAEEKGKKHMTEAEKSILHLRKREEMQRKKWEKFNRNKDAPLDPMDDDFAKNIEKTLATILNKKEKEAAAVSGEEDKVKDEEKEKRGKKRRKNEKDRAKNKQRRVESPKSEEIDENEMLNIRGGSPERRHEEKRESPSVHSDESYDSEYSSDRSRSDDRPRRREGKKAKRNREHGRERKNRDRERRNEQQPLKDSQGVCVFYLQGKCQKNDCPYSHEAVPPMKLELCKFYVMDCCAKGEKCLYMHSEFPCKFYHTGLNCAQGDNCKFAHGGSLSEGLKQILFKHIETAPRDILGAFPRMSREEALNLINITQNKLQEQQGGEVKEEPKGGIPSLFDINVPVPPELLQGSDDGKCQGKNEKGRNRPSRWQDPDPLPSKDMSFPLKPFNYSQDQDMRIRNSNGDIDMRTLPPTIAPLAQPTLPLPPAVSSLVSESSSNELDLEKYKREAGILSSPPKQDLDIRSTNLLSFTASKDVDIRQQALLVAKDVDIRQIPNIFDDKSAVKTSDVDTEDEAMLQIDTGDEVKQDVPGLPLDLPKTQRDLFLRIQAQQKETVVERDSKEGFEMDDNINWYSDDDDEDDNRLTIKVDNEDVKEKEEAPEKMDTTEPFMSPPQIKPFEMVEKLGDLSKIDISEEVTKLLTSMSQARNPFPFLKGSTEVALPAAPVAPAADPRLTRQLQDPRVAVDKADPPRPNPRLVVLDPRQRSRQGSTETQVKPEKLSIYEQGSIDRNAPPDLSSDFRSSMRSDVDLRNLALPFKGMQNYTPATEIDASINSHLPMAWKVFTVEIPRPDYTGLKLSINDAEKTGDPRLRKIFRLSTEERDTPLSPKASPKSSTTTRVDPRLRKLEEAKAETTVGAMGFNQQLTMLQSSAFYQSLTSNQKLLLNQELSQRGDSSNSHDPVLNSLLSNLNIIPGSSIQSNPTLGTALSILSNVSKLNPMLPQAQQGNLPVNPAILGQNPNLMNQMAQSIAQPGLLGAAPGIPNLPPDFPINFDPRNGGLLGNAPMPFGGFQPQEPGNFNNFNEEFYPPDNSGNFHNNQGNRDGRGFNRDRRRGRNNFNRNNAGNRNFRNRNNRANRTHSPP